MAHELYLTLARHTLRDTAASVEKTQLAHGVIALIEENEILAAAIREALVILERSHAIAKAS